MHLLVMHYEEPHKEKGNNKMVADLRHPMDIERTLDEMRELRVSLNLSQDNLADLLGVDRSMISRWENGQTRPDYDNLVRLYRILHGLKQTVEATVHG
jgi:DNA-binding transcriptional regulator YiaG